MNQNYHVIPLDSFPPYASLNFKKAYIPRTLDSPIINILYELDNKVQEYGMRIDVDKQVFIDHPFERGSAEEKNANANAANLSLFIAKEIATLKKKHSVKTISNFRRPIFCAE